MQQGTIKTLLTGFGFIERANGEGDLFFHAKDLVDAVFDDLKIGDVLMFEIGSGPKGPKAENVSLANNGGSAGASDDESEEDEEDQSPMGM